MPSTVRLSFESQLHRRAASQREVLVSQSMARKKATATPSDGLFAHRSHTALPGQADSKHMPRIVLLSLKSQLHRRAASQGEVLVSLSMAH